MHISSGASAARDFVAMVLSNVAWLFRLQSPVKVKAMQRGLGC